MKALRQFQTARFVLSESLKPGWAVVAFKHENRVHQIPEPFGAALIAEAAVAERFAFPPGDAFVVWLNDTVLATLDALAGRKAQPNMQAQFG